MKIDVDVEKLAEDNGYKAVDDMYSAVAVGDQSVRDLLPTGLIDGAAEEETTEQQGEAPKTRIVQELEVEALDRPRLLLDITLALAALSVNVVGATIDSPLAGEAATIKLKVEVANFDQARTVINKLRAIQDVVDVRRINGEG